MLDVCLLQYLARRPVHRLRQTHQAPGVQGLDDLGRIQAESTNLMRLLGPFNRFVEQAVRASTTCLIMADHNRYSVDAQAAGAGLIAPVGPRGMRT